MCVYAKEGKKLTITLPSTLKSIESSAFGNGYLKSQEQWKPSSNTLRELDKLIIKAETPPEITNWLEYYYPLGLNYNTTIYVPNGTSEVYKNTGIWCEYNILEMSELTGINDITVDDNAKQGADDDVYYDLQGRKVTNPQKGVYIHQGKKVMIK